MITLLCRTPPPPPPKSPRKTGIPEKIAALCFAGCSPFHSGPHPGAIRAPISLREEDYSQNFRTDHRVYNQAGSTQGQYNDPRAHRTTENLGDTDCGSLKGTACRRSPQHKAHAISRHLCKSNRCSFGRKCSECGEAVQVDERPRPDLFALYVFW